MARGLPQMCSRHCLRQPGSRPSQRRGQSSMDRMSAGGMAAIDTPDLFDKIRLPPELDSYLRSINPWWEGKPGRVLPPYRRWAFPVLLRRLESKVAPIVVLRGARQVGKTTLQE